MGDKSVRYAPECKRQMVDLVRSGRSPASLAKEFGPTAWTIALWVRQAKRDTGKGDGGLTTPEREELAHHFLQLRLKGRFEEGRRQDDHILKDRTYPILEVMNGALKEREAPMLNALNEVLRDDFIRDSVSGGSRWNKVIERRAWVFD